jgi:hypothetical protein
MDNRNKKTKQTAIKINQKEEKHRKKTTRIGGLLSVFPHRENIFFKINKRSTTTTAHSLFFLLNS